MAQIVKELRVDVSQPNVFQAIVAKQHDSNSRFLKITLVDFGVKVEVPNTAKVTINANRPDGASESFKGEANNDGTITVPLAQWMLDIDGEVKCDVSVTNTEDNKRLTSTDFWLEVQKAANPNASIPLDPDGEILIIKPVTEINENSKDADYPSAKAVYDYGQSIAADTQITATATGSAITIDSANAPLQNLKLFGKTTQNGTPTPTEPKELKSVGDSGSYSVGVYGGNLLPYPYVEKSQTTKGLTINVDDKGIITINGTAEDGGSFCFANKPIYVNGNITISAIGGSTTTYHLIISYDNGRSATVTNSSVTRAIQNSINSVNLYWVAGAVFNNVVIRPMINYGTTVLSYEPYNKQSITFTDTLRGIGDIADEKDFARGVKIQRFEKVVLNGSEAWTNNGNKQGYGVVLNNVGGDFRKSNVICDKLKSSVQNNIYEGLDNYIIATRGDTSKIYIRIDETITTVELLKQWLSNNPITVVYPLKEPIETPISESELNAYRHLVTNKGNTTILSDAEAEVDYYINKPNAQAIGNIHSQVNKDYLKLQQAIISTGGNV